VLRISLLISFRNKSLLPLERNWVEPVEHTHHSGDGRLLCFVCYRLLILARTVRIKKKQMLNVTYCVPSNATPIFLRLYKQQKDLVLKRNDLLSLLLGMIGSKWLNHIVFAYDKKKTKRLKCYFRLGFDLVSIRWTKQKKITLIPYYFKSARVKFLIIFNLNPI